MTTKLSGLADFMNELPGAKGKIQDSLKQQMTPKSLGKGVIDQVIPTSAKGVLGGVGAATTVANTAKTIGGAASEYKDKVEGAQEKAESEVEGSRWNPLTFAKRKMVANKERQQAKDTAYQRAGEAGIRAAGGAMQNAAHGAIMAGLEAPLAATGIGLPAAVATHVAVGAGLNATVGKATNFAAEKLGPSAGKAIQNFGK